MVEIRAHQDHQTAILHQIQQHLRVLPSPQPDLSSSLVPTLHQQRCGLHHLRMSLPESQLSQKRHHLYLRLPLLDHRTSLYLIVFTYYISGDLSLFWMLYKQGLDVLPDDISYCTFSYSYIGIMFFIILSIFLFPLLITLLFLFFFLFMWFLLYDSDSISFRRYHFLPLFSIALETLRAMLISVGWEN